jgi:LPS sulfotransferase NodH
MGSLIRASYVVCATPRSGSTLLCKLLAATAVAGRPEEYFERLRHSGLPRQPREYFEDVEDPALLELLAPTEPGHSDGRDPLADALRPGTTSNGVFGSKLMWTHLLDLAARAGRQAEPALLTERLPALRFVHMTRADKIAQAVSLWRAVQTRAWRADDQRGPDEAVYAFAGIDHLVSQLRKHDDAWSAWFAEHDLQPLVVRYEELARDPQGTVGRVLRFVGAGDADVPAPPLRRQADERSAEWVARYAAEAVRARACRTCSGSSPTRSTSCARSPPSSSGRSCCSRAARTRSCCCAWRRRRSGPAACRSR